VFGLFETGFSGLTWGSIVMILIVFVLLYLGNAKNM
jgi:Na+-transporting methylmalonyl-CoA/oxaloacetate decarboxylase beta subunit